MKRPAHANRSGAALMLALWALFLLSAMVIAWALDIDSQIALSGNSTRVLEAEAMASSGAEVALDPQVEAGSTALHGSLGKNQSYDVRIVGEGGRLNLNWIVTGEDPQRLAILRKYLANKGIDINELDHMMDCLLDFVDPDDIPRLNGAEAEPGYQPKNALLQRIEELKQVKGWEKFTAQKTGTRISRFIAADRSILPRLRAMSCSPYRVSTNRLLMLFFNTGAVPMGSTERRTIRSLTRSIRFGLHLDSHRINLRSFPA